MMQTDFTVSRFDNGRFENQFHLILPFLERRKCSLDKHFTSFQCDFGGSSRIEFAEMFQYRCECFTDGGTLGARLDVTENCEDEVIFRSNSCMGQYSLDNFSHI